MNKRIISLCFSLTLATLAIAQDSFVAFKSGQKTFPLVVSGKTTALVLDNADHVGVIRAAKDLKSDIGSVTGASPELRFTKPSGREVVLIGTIGKSAWIDQLIKSKKLDVTDVKGKWETFVIQVVEKPMKGVDRALVIAGSDKRGTIYGIYEVSQQIGVSPWYFWADVVPQKNASIFIKPGRYVHGEPAVKYRGIFLNDEEPALGRWAVETYGGFNHQFYEKVFELILRLKGNYIWPAMWWASFNSDDTLNPKIADEYGVVMGTSHHEPMNRAHAEWKPFNGGAWNYETNPEKLREFWTQGIKRMGDRETIISMAMRGDGDMAMTEDTNIELLQRIVRDQRQIIEQVTKKDITKTPQLWALYKEVQDYYDKGMRTPDDVTLLLCDDNWGNNRKLPKLTDPPRLGGYGIYYHFDYVGGPRNYKWLNTNPIARVWEQMNLAYEYGANRIWIVNVGDLKPMEFPISFFLDFAWNPKSINHNALEDYTVKWVTQQFGETHAKDIARIISQYTKFNSRRKPELLSPTTYSLIHYREAERVVTEYNNLAAEAERIYAQIPSELKDAYYQLVLHPVKACANLNELYFTVGKNRMYADQGRVSANDLADHAKVLFNRDVEFSRYYNKELAGGKWNNMMNQTHISYTYWQQPEKDVLPEVKSVTALSQAEMGVAIEGSSSWWPAEKSGAVLPEFDNNNRPSRYIEIFNRGKNSFTWSITSSAPWIILSQTKGTVETQQRVEVSVNWNSIPSGLQNAMLTVTASDGKSVPIKITANNQSLNVVRGFVEHNGYISIEASHFSRAVNTPKGTWSVLPDHGRTGSAITTFPVTEPAALIDKNSPYVEYVINLADADSIVIHTLVSPTIDFHNGGGLRCAISLDDQEPQIINIHKDNSLRAWEKSVRDNVITSASKHGVAQKGEHVLKFWRVDPGVVLQKIIIDAGGLKPSYLGPPESFQVSDQH